MDLKLVKEGLKYSIIIVSYNTVGMLSRCIESVYKHTENFEIIVVDNGSTDGSAGYLREMMLSKENFKAIFNDDNKNFGPANNQGLHLAEGEVIVLLNSDTIATPKWLERLELCLNHGEKIAMVGPVCNSSNGRQQVAINGDPTYPLDSKAIQWANTYGGQYTEAGVLYGWCMVIRREFLAGEGYLFDEIFTNSFEDNDLCMRARLKGWRLFIDYGTYIHHEGQASFKKVLKKEFRDKYMENGKKNQEYYFSKYQDNRPKKLVAVYRIANCEQYIRESMERTSQFADEIVCLFARSQDKTKEIALSFPKVTAWEEWNEPEHPFDEQAERNWLLQKAIERGADWVISIDGDEVYEEKFIEMVPALMNNPNPQILAYWCNWRTIWDKDGGVEKFRADGIFGGFQNYRFFKVLPGIEIKRNDNIYNHHCGSAPSFPPENIKWLNVRVKHLGYDSPEQRRRKYEFYRKADPRPLAKDVGNADYHHLIDKNVLLKTYREHNRLSVMTVCKNEEEFIYDMLSNTDPIADEYVIVDTGSEDKTIAEIERFAKACARPVRIFQEKFDSDENGMLLNYSQAKNFAKSKCRYEWIMNMDADELWMHDQVSSLYGLLDEDIDAFLVRVINYLEEPRGPRPEDARYSISESMRIFRNIDEIFYSGLIHESLEDSLSVRCRNGKGKVLMSPIHLHHRGYLRPKERVREKVDRYHKINEKQFEVSGNQDPRPLFNMALHLFNDGREKEGLDLYYKSLEMDPDFWRSKQNLGFYYMGQAKRFLNDAIKGMPSVYVEGSKVKEMADYLAKYDFDMPKVG